MTLDVECTGGCRFQLPESERGRSITCPECSLSISIPVQGTDREGQLRYLAEASGDMGNPFAFLLSEKSAEGEVELEPVRIEFDDESRLDGWRVRVWLAKCYAGGLAILGSINAAPIVIQWYSQPASFEETLPRWSLFLLLISMVFFAYAVYLWQLADWSSLLVVSLITLSVGLIYGFLAAGWWFDPLWIERWLQFPQMEWRQGPIWSGLLACLCALVSFILGREALVWHRRARLRLR